MPKGNEDVARAFYTGQLGLREIPKPEPLRVRGGVWFDAGGLDIHLSGGRTAFWSGRPAALRPGVRGRGGIAGQG